MLYSCLVFFFLLVVKALGSVGQETYETLSYKYFSKLQNVLEEFSYNIYGMNSKSKTYIN